MKQLARNCGLLLLPALLWNWALAGALPAAFAPDVFWREIPGPLAAAENGLRAVVFTLPFFLRFDDDAPRGGWLLYGGGSLLYFGSWLPLLLAPDGAWAQSAAGFLAPAVTPLLWLSGIALVGRRFSWWGGYRWWMYQVVALLFVAAHVAHAALVFSRLR